MRYILLLFVMLSGFGFAPTHAAVTLEAFTFEHKDEELRFKHLIEKVRCLVCQNQSLADSDAELAHDLRAEVYTMMRTGRSDDEVLQFLVARYGDFVLYDPPVKPSTYLIWYGPFVLLLVAGLLLVRAVLRQRNTRAPELSAAERKHLDEVLGSDPAERNGKQ